MPWILGSGPRVRLRGVLMGDGSRVLWTVREDAAPSAGDEAGELARTRRALGDALAQLHRERSEAAALAHASREGLATAQAAMESQACAKAALAGELRGPVDVVVAWSRRLRREGLTGEERAAALATVERHGLAQAALVDELLDEADRPGRGSRPRCEGVERSPGGRSVRLTVETTSPDGGMRYIVTLPTTGCEGALATTPTKARSNS